MTKRKRSTGKYGSIQGAKQIAGELRSFRRGFQKVLKSESCRQALHELVGASWKAGQFKVERKHSPLAKQRHNYTLGRMIDQMSKKFSAVCLTKMGPEKIR